MAALEVGDLVVDVKTPPQWGLGTVTRTEEDEDGVTVILRVLWHSTRWRGGVEEVIFPMDPNRRPVPERASEEQILKLVMDTRNWKVYLDAKERNKTFYKEGKHSDFKIICGNPDQETRTSIPCHKVFLANESPYFAGMFESGMQEAENAEVEIKDYNVEVVKTFVEYFYTKKIEPQMMKSNMHEFLKIADQFRVESLMAYTQAEMAEAITKDNVLELMLSGHRYHGFEIKAAAIDFLVKNRDCYSGLRDDLMAVLRGDNDLWSEITDVAFGLRVK